MRTRLAAAALWGGLGLLTVVLAGCGGGSSSNTGPSGGIGGGGGSSGAVVQGQLVNRRAANGESVVVVVLRTALGIGLAEAAPVAGVNVILTRQDDGATATVQSDATGNFIFPNVLPGTYTITVQDPVTLLFLPVDQPDSFTVGAGDAATITGTVTDSAVNLGGVTVVAVESDPTIVLANDAQMAHLLNIAKAAGLVSADPVFQLRQSGLGLGTDRQALQRPSRRDRPRPRQRERRRHRGLPRGPRQGQREEQREQQRQEQRQGQEERSGLSRSAPDSAPPGATRRRRVDGGRDSKGPAHDTRAPGRCSLRREEQRPAGRVSA